MECDDDGRGEGDASTSARLEDRASLTTGDGEEAEDEALTEMVSEIM